MNINRLFGGSLTAYWTSFGLGFAVRPLGAYVLGKLSDDRSRKLSFIIAMLSMALSTSLMSLVPAVCGQQDVTVSYCVNSVYASAIPVIVLRCVQGFSAGAAAGGVNVIQTELWGTSARKGAIAQSVGVQNFSGGLASMLSAAIVYGLRAAMGETKYAAWGWRLAFIVVVPPSLLASCLLHKSVPESNDFVKRDGHSKESFEENTQLGRLLDSHMNITEGRDGTNEEDNKTTSSISWWLLLPIVVFSQFAIGGFNQLSVFLVEFAQSNFGVSSGTATLMQVVGKGVQVLMTPFAAFVGDVKGFYWASAFGGILCTILALPILLIGQYGGVASAWIMISVLLPIVSTFWILNAPLMASSIFPVDVRSRGTSMVLATAAAFAGFLPLVLEEIPNTYWQGGTLTIIAALGTVGIVWVRQQCKRGNIIIYQRPELY